MAMTSLRDFRLAMENRFATNFNQLLPYMFDVKLDLTKAAPSELSVVYSNFSSSERRILPPLYSAVYYGRVYKIFYVKYPEIIAHAHKYPCGVYTRPPPFLWEAWGRG